MLKVSIQEDTCISHWFSRRREDIGVLNFSCTMTMICKVTGLLNSPGLQAKSELSRPFRPRAAPTSCCYLLWAAFLPTCPALLKALSAPGDASTSTEAVVLCMPSPLLKCPLPAFTSSSHASLKTWLICHLLQEVFLTLALHKKGTLLLYLFLVLQL